MTTWGTSIDQRGAVKPSNLEQEVFDVNVGAYRYIEIPSNLQMRVAYNDDGTILYTGYAARSLAASADGWLLQKFSYDASKRVTLRQIAYSSWDLRADAGTTYA